MVCLGDTVPDFTAESTKGPIKSFHDFCRVCGALGLGLQLSRQLRLEPFCMSLDGARVPAYRPHPT
jgi:hypothetical protein